jgi:mycothiol synthase
MKLTMRPYRTEDDYWRIRNFLRQVMLANGLRELSWHVARLDYWRWHVALNCQGHESIADLVTLWETEDGRIAAVLNPEDPGHAHLQVHPEMCNPELELEMLAVAEEQMAVVKDGVRILTVWTKDQNDLSLGILKRCGYTKGKWVESQWRRDLDTPISESRVPPGYTVRSLGDVDEIPARSWASWRGFHPDEPDDDYLGWPWYHNIQRCPLYRRDLDIVAVAPGGEIASFCTMWYDDFTRTAYIEPVATVPEHLRLGLARANLTEGLRRLQKLGARRAFVSGFEPGPNALYASVLSSEHDRNEEWVKRW